MKAFSKLATNTTNMFGNKLGKQIQKFGQKSYNTVNRVSNIVKQGTQFYDKNLASGTKIGDSIRTVASLIPGGSSLINAVDGGEKLIKGLNNKTRNALEKVKPLVSSDTQENFA